MVSINTNLQSLIVQQNLTKSTNALNLAIERMTTGFKINHASDNAAGYSIAQDMVNKLSSYDVAAENISMGIDLVSTAQGNITLMQSHAERIHNLITQAQNGTYGGQSLDAINSEAQARIEEINRIYANTEYNGINIFESIQLPDWAEEVKAGAGTNLENAYGDFIADPVTHTQAEVDALTHVSELPSFVSGGKYQVSTKEDLIKLAELVNSNNDTTNVTFVMGADIDLSSVENWTPIGDEDNQFKGTFDGNGHKITNLKIDNETKGYQGLFGFTSSGSTIKNVGVDGVVKGNTFVGGLVGLAYGAVTNCYATGFVTGTGTQGTGGLVGMANGAVNNCYATGSVTGTQGTGGLVGGATEVVNNCYATGTVTGTDYTGGLAGMAAGAVNNCYATGSVTGTVYSGGLVGITAGVVKNCYATSSVTGTDGAGGLVGFANGAVNNCYATGSVTGTSGTGGLVGLAGEAVNNCYATGFVTGTGNWIGGLIGQLNKTSGTLNLDKIESSGAVSSQGSYAIGNLIGGIANTDNGTSFSTININNASALSSSLDMIGFEGKDNGTPYQSGQMEGWLSNITELIKPSTTLQVGINGNSSSQITFESSLSYDLSALISKGAQDKGAFDVINKFLNDLSARATELGAVTNRLDSALESTTVAMENITSSLSTTRDADIAKESSAYIKAQILQQASATLLATANQSPSIALQLI